MALLPADPQQRQKVLLGALLVLGLGYVGYQYVYRPRAARAAELRAQVEELEKKNEAARTLARTTGAEEAQRQLAQYRALLAAVEALVPSSEELPDLLDAISAEAQRSGVELSLIQPTGAVQEGVYVRRTYDLAAIGDYHSLATFLTRIASLPRIVVPRNLQLTPRTSEANRTPGVQPLEARFSIETYVIPTPGSAPAADTAPPAQRPT